MSAPESAEGVDVLRMFVGDAAGVEGASASWDEAELTAEVTYREHDGDSEIDARPVFDLANKYDLRIEGAVFDVDTPEARIEVAVRE